MSIDYGEIICTAVDEIVAAKLQGLQYDITKLCTVIDDTFSYQGKYIVSDGTARYEAYSTDKSYKNGNSVLVVIPNGDHSMQKIISGRVAANDTTPFNYVSPMDTMIKITTNIFDDSKTIYGDNVGLLANDNNKSTVIGPLYSISETGNFAGFTRLGITAGFRSWLAGLDVAAGTYGIKVLIYTDIADAPGSTKKNAVYELTFSSADMIGNPYQFDSYFYQEKVFDISNINNIQQIDVYFYQNGQFYDGNGNYIPWQDEDSEHSIGLAPSTKPNNLFVNDVKIYLGYEAGAFTKETLMLYSPDSLTYHYEHEDLQKDIALRWIHMIDEKNFELLNGDNLDDKFEIHWFKYHPGYENINQYAGKDWEEVYPENNNLFSYVLTPDVKKQYEQIKAIGLIKEVTGSKTTTQLDGVEIIEDIYTVTPYYSNLLIFENEINVPDEVTWDASTALSIVCMDGSEGNYYIYNQNGKINNEGIGKGYKRYLKAMYQGAEITSSLGKLDWIKWYFPVERTMILETDAFYEENNGIKSNVVTSYKGVDYDSVTRKATANQAGDFELVAEQAYSIDNQWSFQNANNTVRCQVSIDGVIYEAIEELRFGKAGTNGTNITFLIEFANNENALIAEEGATVDVQARLYDATGARSNFTNEESKKIEWSWYKYTTKLDEEAQQEIDIKYITLPATDEDGKVAGNKITLTAQISEVPMDNYYILQAKYNNLITYLPIPLKTKDTSFIEGAREIVYNHQGVPNYYNDAYVLYYWDSEDSKYKEHKNGVWNCKYSEHIGDSDLTKGYIPTLKKLDSRPGYVALSASPIYASGYNDKVCVSYIHDIYGWAQPILIMQSRYDFAMLNQWDNSLTMDEENGTILSTILGAGRKNQDDNTFSGVLIGDIQQGTDLNEASSLTGVYGLHRGEVSYALTEDGVATFGKSGRGQIKIDGNESIIQSASYELNNEGMKIDLDDGVIEIKANNFTFIPIVLTADSFKPNHYYYQDSEGNYLLAKTYNAQLEYYEKQQASIFLSPGNNSQDSYFKVVSEHNSPLINIGPTGYYLQSDNGGTYLDLTRGLFEAKSDDQKNAIHIAPASPYFNIQANDINLMHVADNNYYLQSENYQIHKDTSKYRDYNNDGYVINNAAMEVYKYNDKFISMFNKKYVYNIRSDEMPYYFIETSEYVATQIVSENDDDYRIVLERYLELNDIEEDALTDEQKDIIKQTTLENRETNIGAAATKISGRGSGVKIDLQHGNISGYNLMLKASNTEDPESKYVIINGSAQEYPLVVGPKFKVNWDGTLYCDNIEYLGTKPQQSNYVININDHFTVSSGGGVSASSGYFGGGWFGGSAAVAKTAEIAKYAESAGITSALQAEGFAEREDASVYIDGWGRVRQGKPAGWYAPNEGLLGLSGRVTDIETKITELEKRISKLE